MGFVGETFVSFVVHFISGRMIASIDGLAFGLQAGRRGINCKSSSLEMNDFVCISMMVKMTRDRTQIRKAR